MQGWLGVPLILILAGVPTVPSEAPPVPGDDSWTIEMQPLTGETRREKNATGVSGLLARLLGRKDETMAWRGVLKLDGRDHVFYLPRASRYTHVNEGEDASHHRNRSTRISVDADGNGRLTRDESWFASLPIRLGDRMVEVVDLAADGSRIRLRPSKAPLRGLVEGRECPPFSLETTTGETVSREDYEGKILLLDVWSVT